MTTPSEVLEHALGLRSGSRADRARAGVAALRQFLDLSPADKRDLAVLVAQRVAPELVPRIRAEGGVDLTDEQSRAVLDMVRRLDGDDLAELAAAVRTPEARRAALAAVGDAAAASAGLDDVVARPGARLAAGDTTATSGPTDEPVDAALSRHRADLEARLQALEADLAAANARARSAEEAERRAEAALERARQEATDEARMRIRELEAEVQRLRRDAERDAERAEREVARLRERLRAATRRPAAGPAARKAGARPADSATTTSPPGPAAAAGPSADAALDRLVARLAEAGAGQALRIVTVAVDRLVDTTPQQRRRVLATIPDGWARRRALERLVEAGAVTADEVGLLDLLARRGDRVFAAGRMVDHGLATPSELAAHLDTAALTRLERRKAS